MILLSYYPAWCEPFLCSLPQFLPLQDKNNTICRVLPQSVRRVKTWGFGFAEDLFDLEIAGLENSICLLSRALDNTRISLHLEPWTALLPPGAARRQGLSKAALIWLPS